MKLVKKIAFVFCLSLIAVMTLTTVSCDLMGTSISSRIDKFVASLNLAANRNLSSNFHSDISGTYTGEVLFNGTTLDIGNRNFSITLTPGTTPVHNGETAQSGTISIKYGQVSQANYGVTFHFKEDGANNWMIYYISIPSGLGGPWGS